MNRRDFFKITAGVGMLGLLPDPVYSNSIDFNKVNFSNPNNGAQTIILFLYGGASQLVGNMTNFDEIESKSLVSYRTYFSSDDRIRKTAHGFWEFAGGNYLEDMLNDGSMTLFRSCYSQVRESANNKAHGICVAQNQKGTFDQNNLTSGGVVTNIAKVLEDNGVIDKNTRMPFVSMEGDSDFYAEGVVKPSSFLRAVSINERFDNPYDMFNWSELKGYLYCSAEEIKEGKCGNQYPSIDGDMTALAQSVNREGKIRDAFLKIDSLSNFINDVKDTAIPSSVSYPSYNEFADKLKTAIKILDANPDTKIITLGNGGLGGWDHHENAYKFTEKSKALFSALKSAVSHLRAINKIDKINIIVFSEFGRNVNLNSANGWDHGNLQNVYIFGGTSYFNHKGVVGETKIETSVFNRIWQKPQNGSYWFEPLSIAATIYKLYGITNPEYLTGGYKPIDI
jgi:hypothetical protein